MRILGVTAVLSDAPPGSREQQAKSMLAHLGHAQPLLLGTARASLAIVAESIPGTPVTRLDELPGSLCHRHRPVDQVQLLITETARLNPDGQPIDPEQHHYALLEIRDGLATLTRSMCGLFSLFYQHLDGQLLISSDERCLLMCSDQTYTLNPHRIACHLALQDPDPGSTFFREIRQAVPMHALTLDPMHEARARRQRIESFQVDPDVRQMSKADAQAELISRLDRSVERSLSAVAGEPGHIGLAVSGGMDSTAVASSLVRTDKELTAYSWDFADFPDANEHVYTDALREHLGLRVERVRIDQPEPLGDAFMAIDAPIQAPMIDPYRVLRQQLATRARADGVTTLMTGDFGDHLYLGQHYHLRDAWRARMPGIASITLARLRDHGIRGLRRQDSLRRLLPFNGWSRRFGPPPVAWLTASAQQRLLDSQDPQGFVDRIAEPDRYEACLSVHAVDAARLGRLIHSRWGIDQHYPLRDPALIRFMLSLPAHYLTDPASGQSKWLMREALRQRLPDTICRRVGKTSFISIFMHGLQQHRQRAERILFAEDACWRDYISPDWMAPQLERWQFCDRGLMILWQMISLELWISGLGANIDY